MKHTATRLLTCLLAATLLVSCLVVPGATIVAETVGEEALFSEAILGELGIAPGEVVFENDYTAYEVGDTSAKAGWSGSTDSLSVASVVPAGTEASVNGLQFYQPNENAIAKYQLSAENFVLKLDMYTMGTKKGNWDIQILNSEGNAAYTLTVPAFDRTTDAQATSNTFRIKNYIGTGDLYPAATGYTLNVQHTDLSMELACYDGYFYLINMNGQVISRMPSCTDTTDAYQLSLRSWGAGVVITEMSLIELTFAEDSFASSIGAKVDDTVFYADYRGYSTGDNGDTTYKTDLSSYPSTVKIAETTPYNKTSKVSGLNIYNNSGGATAEIDFTAADYVAKVSYVHASHSGGYSVVAVSDETGAYNAEIALPFSNRNNDNNHSNLLAYKNNINVRTSKTQSFGACTKYVVGTDVWNFCNTDAKETVTLRNIGCANGMLVNWGDGNWEPSVASLATSSKTHTYTTAGEKTISISGDITTLGGGTSAICSCSGAGFVSDIVVRNPSILTINQYAFLNMTKCSQIVFEDGNNASNCTFAAANAFSGLGSALSVRWIFGISYRTLVEVGMWDSSTVPISNFPKTGDTLFETLDGYIQNGEFLFSGIQYSASFTERKEITLRETWYWSFTGTDQYIYNGVTYWPNVKYLLAGPNGWHPPNTSSRYGLPSVSGRVFSEKETYSITHRAFLGPFHFKNDRTGYITISDDHSQDGPLQSGLGVDLPVKTAGNTTSTRNPTIRVTGRLIGVDSLIQQTPDEEFPSPRVSNLKFGVACELSSIGSFSNVSSTRIREGAVSRRDGDDSGLTPIEPPDSDFIWLPDTIEFFGAGCFAGNDEIADLSWLPSCLTNVSYKCFADCPNLSSISGLTNAENLLSIGDYAFANCYGISGTNSIPSSVSTLGKMMFLNIGQKAESPIVVDFGSRTKAEILGMLGSVDYEIDNRIHTYNPSDGAKSKIVLKCHDGYLVDTCEYDPETKEYSSVYKEYPAIPD